MHFFSDIAVIKVITITFYQDNHYRIVLIKSGLKSSPSPKSNLFKELRLVLKRYVRQESQRGQCTKKKTLRKNFICKYKKLNEV